MWKLAQCMHRKRTLIVLKRILSCYQNFELPTWIPLPQNPPIWSQWLSILTLWLCHFYLRSQTPLFSLFCILRSGFKEQQSTLSSTFSCCDSSSKADWETMVGGELDKGDKMPFWLWLRLKKWRLSGCEFAERDKWSDKFLGKVERWIRLPLLYFPIQWSFQVEWVFTDFFRFSICDEGHFTTTTTDSCLSYRKGLFQQLWSQL